MNKTELIVAVAKKAGHTKMDCSNVVDAFFEIIGDALAHGESVQLIGFGAFGVTETKARTICHPQDGYRIQLPAGKRPKFTAGAKLKAAVIKGW